MQATTNPITTTNRTIRMDFDLNKVDNNKNIKLSPAKANDTDVTNSYAIGVLERPFDAFETNLPIDFQDTPSFETSTYILYNPSQLKFAK